MKNIQSIKFDKRFYINELDLERIKKRKISKYEFIEIPVGRVRRYLDGKIFDLYHTDAYKLLDNPNNKETQKNYEEYCKNYCYEYENRGRENFKNLANSIRANEYDPLKGVIVVDQLYIIADGQHRCCILLNKFGPKYKIKVLKIKYNDIGIKTYIRNFAYNIKQFFKCKNY